MWSIMPALTAAFSAAPGAPQDYRPVPPEIAGEIGAGDAVDGQGRRYDEYSIELRRGQDLLVTVENIPGSRLFPVVKLYEPGGRTAVAGSDDHGREIIAPIIFTARRPGLYRIRVVAEEGSSGGYLLQIAGEIMPAAGPGPYPAPPPPARGPFGRFIICPGNPRCPR
jgi:hypothetical protein